jgi:site-specific DNA-methyltransferase (adenine-specific)
LYKKPVKGQKMTVSRVNTLYHGDNLDILRRYIQDYSIDLVYLDPPFCSNRNYNLAYKETDSRVQKAFSDTWKWDDDTQDTLQQLLDKHPASGRIINALVQGIGYTQLTAYLVMMTPRLLEIHRVLKETGSIYLHCDPSAGHYLKILLDMIFDSRHFRNEIAWSYKGGGRSKKFFARKHDTIFFYTKSDKWTFNYIDILVDRTNRTYFTDENGGRYWLKYGKRYYLKHEGKVPEDWWADIDPLHGPYNERLGYPTQKPLALLERIIRASSNEGDIVLDPFCGCGTTLVAAQQLNRKWTGIDISRDAIEITAQRLRNTFPGIEFEVNR